MYRYASTYSEILEPSTGRLPVTAEKPAAVRFQLLWTSKYSDRLSLRLI